MLLNARWEDEVTRIQEVLSPSLDNENFKKLLY